MMNLDMEFRTRTNLGLTYCNYFAKTSANLRDVDNVDYVINVIKKLFSKTHFDPCVTLRDEIDTYGRIFDEWKDGKQGYTVLYFNRDGSKDEFFLEKLSTRDIKAFYINCVELATRKVA